MDHDGAYAIAKDAVDEAVFCDHALLDAYNEMVGSDAPGFSDKVQEPVFDLEDAARHAAGEQACEEAAEEAARIVAAEGAEEVVGHLRACAREAGIAL